MEATAMTRLPWHKRPKFPIEYKGQTFETRLTHSERWMTTPERHHFSLTEVLRRKRASGKSIRALAKQHGKSRSEITQLLQQ